jgi:hypothetical protein
LKNQTPDAYNFGEETVMKRSSLFLLVLICLTTFANAGSVVVWDGGRHVGTSFGQPLEIAKERALANARHNGWRNVRIIGFSDVTGYGAIVVARHPNGVGALIGVSLGNQSKRQAVAIATDLCRKAGGTDAHVKYSFRG